MKKYPFCSEQIQKDAIICRYYGKDLSEGKQITWTRNNYDRIQIGLLLIIFLSILVINGLLIVPLLPSSLINNLSTPTPQPTVTSSTPTLKLTPTSEGTSIYWTLTPATLEPNRIQTSLAGAGFSTETGKILYYNPNPLDVTAFGNEKLGYSLLSLEKNIADFALSTLVT